MTQIEDDPNQRWLLSKSTQIDDDQIKDYPKPRRSKSKMTQIEVDLGTGSMLKMGELNLLVFLH